jgi:hypothetical protein
LGRWSLNVVPCPVCKGTVTGVAVDEGSISNTPRVPVLVLAKCKKGHAVVLPVHGTFAIRDVEAAGDAVQLQGKESSLDKTQSWMDSV